MRRHRHRYSKDVDIFIPDPQYLGYLSPRLNAVAEALTGDYVEQGNFLKLVFPEGEIDFVASAPLTENAFVEEDVLGRRARVETSAEIVAKISPSWRYSTTDPPSTTAWRSSSGRSNGRSPR